jgi:DNA-binding transcriptional LysR family regulator
MKISKYEVFMKIIEYGSLSRAAAYCNYSQSAVSQIVSSLEEELGVTLLNRSHAGVSLTSDGQQLLPYLRQLSHAYQELSEKNSELLGIESGLIRIGSFSSISSTILAPLLKDFRVLHPRIKFELHPGNYKDTETWIQEGSVDLGFVALPAPKDLEVYPLLEDRMLALLPLNHPYAKAPRVPLKIFAQEPVILLEEGNHKEVPAMFRKNKIQPEIAYQTEDDYTIMSMVENGLGIAILAELVLLHNSYRIAIKEIDPPYYRKIALALKSKKQASRAVQCFLDFAIEHLARYNKTKNWSESGLKG